MMNTELETKFFSIAIPSYEMHGRGCEFLAFSFGILSRQTFKDFEVVISDDSKDNDIKELCEKWANKLTINYCKNAQNAKGVTLNTNNALKNCTGKWIKILFQDDYLYGDDALENLHNHIKNNPDKVWFSTAWRANYESDMPNAGTTRDYYNQRYTDVMFLDHNTIGIPSVITIKNSPDKLLFDPQFTWLMDCDFYYRMYKLHGEPCYFNSSINVICRIWKNSTTHTLNNKDKKREVTLRLKDYVLSFPDNINENLEHKIDLFVDNKITLLTDLDIIYQHIRTDKKPVITQIVKQNIRRYIRNNITSINYSFNKITPFFLLCFVYYKYGIAKYGVFLKGKARSLERSKPRSFLKAAYNFLKGKK